MIFPIALALSTHLVLWVADGPPPQIDVEPACSGIAQQSDVSGISLDLDKEMKVCITTEQERRADLVKQWPTFSAADRTSCMNEVTNGGQSTYTEFLICLEMARDVKKLQHHRPQADICCVVERSAGHPHCRPTHVRIEMNRIINQDCRD
jgi:hypothetical protein